MRHAEIAEPPCESRNNLKRAVVVCRGGFCRIGLCHAEVSGKLLGVFKDSSEAAGNALSEPYYNKERKKSQGWIGEKLNSLYSETEGVSGDAQASLFNALGILYDERNAHRKAEEYYRKAIEIRIKLLLKRQS